MPWTQVYNPAYSETISTIFAAAPVVVLLGTLGLLGWSAPRAAAVGLITALAVAIGVYGMPWQSALAAAGYGAGFGLFPIGWIVFAAVFLYVLTVDTGEFDKVKASVVALSPDQRIQALLIAFCFGAFIEGAAGFGTPVAISAALLIGTGFPPLYAAGLALIANTAPVAFGALGTPIITLAKVTGLPEMQLSAMVGRQLPLFSLIIPAWMVCTMAGWRGLKGVWPAVLVCGGTFAALQFLISNYLGASLTDVVAGLGSMIALTALLRVWSPRDIWRFPRSTESAESLAAAIPDGDGRGAAELGNVSSYSSRDIAHAWAPWIILSACVFLWGIPQFRTFLNGGAPQPTQPPAAANESSIGKAQPWYARPNPLSGISQLQWPIPELHQQVRRDTSIVGGSDEPEAAIFVFNWLSATGTGIMFAAILSALWMGIAPARFVWLFFHTVFRLRASLFTIAAMLAIAFTTRYSGSDVTLGLAFTHTGMFYPFFAAMLGWLGVALTGSDTSSNALFGNLQRITAERLDLSPILMCAANSAGGVMGKMIDAQSIVVAGAATNQQGTEGQILRFVFWHSIALASLVGLVTLIQAYLLPGMIPVP
jgi:lactate permease